jgi:hypothetical protein
LSLGGFVPLSQFTLRLAKGGRPSRPREEIRPQFQRTETGGKSGHGALAIRADDREGLHGWWQKTFSVTGGHFYRFSAWRHTENIAVPRRSVLARVLWRDDAGKEVKRREGVVTNFRWALWRPPSRSIRANSAVVMTAGWRCPASMKLH